MTVPTGLAAAALLGAPPLVGIAIARLGRLEAEPLALRRLDVLAPLALLVQLVALPRPLALPLGYLLLAVWAVGRMRAGPPALARAIGLALVGALLNALPILANGRMPYAGAAGAGPGLKGEPLTDGSHLAWLADVIPLLGLRVSAGDLVLAAACAWLAAIVVARPRGSGDARRKLETRPAERVG